MNVLLIEANNDKVTREVHEAREAFYASLKLPNSHTLIRLYGERAIATNVRYASSNPGDLRLISGMGHGGENEFCGHNNHPIFQTHAPTNSACKHAIVHLFSCNCGRHLGKELVASSEGRALAFIGYHDLLILPRTSLLTQYFITTAVEIDFAIMQGLSMRQTKSRADNAYRRARATLISSPIATPRDVASLEMNYNAIVGPWDSAVFGGY
jgi:hypothetical protein